MTQLIGQEGFYTNPSEAIGARLDYFNRVPAFEDPNQRVLSGTFYHPTHNLGGYLDEGNLLFNKLRRGVVSPGGIEFGTTFKDPINASVIKEYDDLLNGFKDRGIYTSVFNNPLSANHRRLHTKIYLREDTRTVLHDTGNPGGGSILDPLKRDFRRWDSYAERKAKPDNYQINFTLISNNEKLWRDSVTFYNTVSAGLVPNSSDTLSVGGQASLEMAAKLNNVKSGDKVSVISPYLDDPLVITALINAKRKGAEVTVVTEDPRQVMQRFNKDTGQLENREAGGDKATKSALLPYLTAEGIKVYTARRDDNLLIHAKGLAILSSDGDRVAGYTGSHNMTTRSKEERTLDAMVRLHEVNKGYVSKLYKAITSAPGDYDLIEYQPPSATIERLGTAELIAFSKGLGYIHRDFSSGNTRQFVQPTTMPDEYWRDVRRSELPKLTHFQRLWRIHYNTPAPQSFIQLDEEMSTPSLGEQLNRKLSPLHPIYQDGDGLIGIIMRSVGMGADWALGSNFYGRQQYFERNQAGGIRGLLKLHNKDYESESGTVETMLTSAYDMIKGITYQIFFYGAVSLPLEHLKAQLVESSYLAAFQPDYDHRLSGEPIQHNRKSLFGGAGEWVHRKLKQLSRVVMFGKEIGSELNIIFSPDYKVNGKNPSANDLMTAVYEVFNRRGANLTENTGVKSSTGINRYEFDNLFSAYGLIGHVRTFDAIRFNHLVAFILHGMNPYSFSAESNSAYQVYRQQVVGLGRAIGKRPYLALRNLAGGTTTPTLGGMGVNRIRDIAKAFDKIGALLPVNPLYWNRTLRNFAGLSEFNPSERLTWRDLFALEDVVHNVQAGYSVATETIGNLLSKENFRKVGQAVKSIDIKQQFKNIVSGKGLDMFWWGKQAQYSKAAKAFLRGQVDMDKITPLLDKLMNLDVTSKTASETFDNTLQAIYDELVISDEFRAFSSAESQMVQQMRKLEAQRVLADEFLPSANPLLDNPSTAHLVKDANDPLTRDKFIQVQKIKRGMKTVGLLILADMALDNAVFKTTGNIFTQIRAAFDAETKGQGIAKIDLSGGAGPVATGITTATLALASLVVGNSFPKLEYDMLNLDSVSSVFYKVERVKAELQAKQIAALEASGDATVNKIDTTGAGSTNFHLLRDRVMNSSRFRFNKTAAAVTFLIGAVAARGAFALFSKAVNWGFNRDSIKLDTSGAVSSTIITSSINDLLTKYQNQPMPDYYKANIGLAALIAETMLVTEGSSARSTRVYNLAHQVTTPFFQLTGLARMSEEERALMIGVGFQFSPVTGLGLSPLFSFKLALENREDRISLDLWEKRIMGTLTPIERAAITTQQVIDTIFLGNRLVQDKDSAWSRMFLFLGTVGAGAILYDSVPRAYHSIQTGLSNLKQTTGKRAAVATIASTLIDIVESPKTLWKWSNSQTQRWSGFSEVSEEYSTGRKLLNRAFIAGARTTYTLMGGLFSLPITGVEATFNALGQVIDNTVFKAGSKNLTPLISPGKLTLGVILASMLFATTTSSIAAKQGHVGENPYDPKEEVFRGVTRGDVRNLTYGATIASSLLVGSYLIGKANNTILNSPNALILKSMRVARKAAPYYFGIMFAAGLTNRGSAFEQLDALNAIGATLLGGAVMGAVIDLTFQTPPEEVLAVLVHRYKARTANLTTARNLRKRGKMIIKQDVITKIGTYGTELADAMNELTDEITNKAWETGQKVWRERTRKFKEALDLNNKMGVGARAANIYRYFRMKTMSLIGDNWMTRDIAFDAMKLDTLPDGSTGGQHSVAKSKIHQTIFDGGSVMNIIRDRRGRLILGAAVLTAGHFLARGISSLVPQGIADRVLNIPIVGGFLQFITGRKPTDRLLERRSADPELARVADNIIKNLSMGTLGLVKTSGAYGDTPDPFINLLAGIGVSIKESGPKTYMQAATEFSDLSAASFVMAVASIPYMKELRTLIHASGKTNDLPTLLMHLRAQQPRVTPASEWRIMSPYTNEHIESLTGQAVAIREFYTQWMRFQTPQELQIDELYRGYRLGKAGNDAIPGYKVDFKWNPDIGISTRQEIISWGAGSYDEKADITQNLLIDQITKRAFRGTLSDGAVWAFQLPGMIGQHLTQSQAIQTLITVGMGGVLFAGATPFIFGALAKFTAKKDLMELWAQSSILSGNKFISSKVDPITLHSVHGDTNLYAHDTVSGKVYKIGQLHNVKVDALNVGRKELIRAVDRIFTSGDTFRGKMPVTLANGKLSVANSVYDVITDIQTVIQGNLLNNTDIRNYLTAIGQTPEAITEVIKDKIELAWDAARNHVQDLINQKKITSDRAAMIEFYSFFENSQAIKELKSSIILPPSPEAQGIAHTVGSTKTKKQLQAQEARLKEQRAVSFESHPDAPAWTKAWRHDKATLAGVLGYGVQNLANWGAEGSSIYTLIETLAIVGDFGHGESFRRDAAELLISEAFNYSAGVAVSAFSAMLIGAGLPAWGAGLLGIGVLVGAHLLHKFLSEKFPLIKKIEQDYIINPLANFLVGGGSIMAELTRSSINDGFFTKLGKGSLSAIGRMLAFFTVDPINFLTSQVSGGILTRLQPQPGDGYLAVIKAFLVPRTAHAFKLDIEAQRYFIVSNYLAAASKLDNKPNASIVNRYSWGATVGGNEDILYRLYMSGSGRVAAEFGTHNFAMSSLMGEALLRKQFYADHATARSMFVNATKKTPFREYAFNFIKFLGSAAGGSVIGTWVYSSLFSKLPTYIPPEVRPTTSTTTTTMKAVVKTTNPTPNVAGTRPTSTGGRVKSPLKHKLGSSKTVRGLKSHLRTHTGNYIFGSLALVGTFLAFTAIADAQAIGELAYSTDHSRATASYRRGRLIEARQAELKVITPLLVGGMTFKATGNIWASLLVGFLSGFAPTKEWGKNLAEQEYKRVSQGEYAQSYLGSGGWLARLQTETVETMVMTRLLGNTRDALKTIFFDMPTNNVNKWLKGNQPKTIASSSVTATEAVKSVKTATSPKATLRGVRKLVSNLFSWTMPHVVKVKTPISTPRGRGFSSLFAHFKQSLTKVKSLNVKDIFVQAWQSRNEWVGVPLFRWGRQMIRDKIYDTAGVVARGISNLARAGALALISGLSESGSVGRNIIYYGIQTRRWWTNKVKRPTARWATSVDNTVSKLMNPLIRLVPEGLRRRIRIKGLAGATLDAAGPLLDFAQMIRGMIAVAKLNKNSTIYEYQYAYATLLSGRESLTSSFMLSLFSGGLGDFVGSLIGHHVGQVHGANIGKKRYVSRLDGSWSAFPAIYEGIGVTNREFFLKSYLGIAAYKTITKRTADLVDTFRQTRGLLKGLNTPIGELSGTTFKALEKLGVTKVKTKSGWKWGAAFKGWKGFAFNVWSTSEDIKEGIKAAITKRLGRGLTQSEEAIAYGTKSRNFLMRAFDSLHLGNKVAPTINQAAQASQGSKVGKAVQTTTEAAETLTPVALKPTIVQKLGNLGANVLKFGSNAIKGGLSSLKKTLAPLGRAYLKYSPMIDLGINIGSFAYGQALLNQAQNEDQYAEAFDWQGRSVLATTLGWTAFFAGGGPVGYAAASIVGDVIGGYAGNHMGRLAYRNQVAQSRVQTGMIGGTILGALGGAALAFGIAASAPVSIPILLASSLIGGLTGFFVGGYGGAMGLLGGRKKKNKHSSIERNMSLYASASISDMGGYIDPTTLERWDEYDESQKDKFNWGKLIDPISTMFRNIAGFFKSTWAATVENVTKARSWLSNQIASRWSKVTEWMGNTKEGQPSVDNSVFDSAIYGASVYEGHNFSVLKGDEFLSEAKLNKIAPGRVSYTKIPGAYVYGYRQGTEVYNRYATNLVRPWKINPQGFGTVVNNVTITPQLIALMVVTMGLEHSGHSRVWTDDMYLNASGHNKLPMDILKLNQHPYLAGYRSRFAWSSAFGTAQFMDYSWDNVMFKIVKPSNMLPEGVPYFSPIGQDMMQVGFIFDPWYRGNNGKTAKQILEQGDWSTPEAARKTWRLLYNDTLGSLWQPFRQITEEEAINLLESARQMLLRGEAPYVPTFARGALQAEVGSYRAVPLMPHPSGPAKVIGGVQVPTGGQLISRDGTWMGVGKSLSFANNKAQGQSYWRSRRLPGAFTSPVGMRTIMGRTAMHGGIDIGIGVGSPVYSPFLIGEVTEAIENNNGGFGYTVTVAEINPVTGQKTGLYAQITHNSDIIARRGQTVRFGEVIAKSGSTGRSTGPHTHTNLISYGANPINPFGQKGFRSYSYEDRWFYNMPLEMLEAIHTGKSNVQPSFSPPAQVAPAQANISQTNQAGRPQIASGAMAANGVWQQRGLTFPQGMVSTGFMGRTDNSGAVTYQQALRAIGAGNVASKISSGIGSRGNRPHKGVDVALPTGYKLSNPFIMGRVLKGHGHGSNPNGYGKYTIIEELNPATGQPTGLRILVAHLHRYAPNLQDGKILNYGDSIGDVGNTGRSNGSHLHLEAIVVGNYRFYDSQGRAMPLRPNHPYGGAATIVPAELVAAVVTGDRRYAPRMVQEQKQSSAPTPPEEHRVVTISNPNLDDNYVEDVNKARGTRYLASTVEDAKQYNGVVRFTGDTISIDVEYPADINLSHQRMNGYETPNIQYMAQETVLQGALF